MAKTATAFQEFDASLSAAFRLLPGISTESKKFFELSPRVAVMLQKIGKDFTQVAIAYEKRPSTWFHLGDLHGQPEYAEILGALRIQTSGIRSDMYSEQQIRAFVNQLILKA